MGGAEDITAWGMLAAYGLLLIPLTIILWLRVPLLSRSLVAVVRMSVQLLLVALYLQFIFDLQRPELTLLWLLVMIVVADLSIARSCKLRLRRLALPLGVGLALGTALPTAVFIGAVVGHDPLALEPQYVIPIAGMILGNCLRADIVGLDAYFSRLRRERRAYEQHLGFGASRAEALAPYRRAAVQAALSPTVATMSTIGLVALPGMMTGVILGGTDPATAVKYQIAIMCAIFSGTALTVTTVLLLATRLAFDAYGNLREDVLKDDM